MRNPFGPVGSEHARLARPLFAQRVFPWAVEAPRPVPLSATVLVVLELLRRSVDWREDCRGDVRRAVCAQVALDFRAARSTRSPVLRSAAISRLRVLRPMRG